jgi:hypothetical protein
MQYNTTVTEAGLLEATAFPNPARQSFMLQLKCNSNKPLQLLVFDAAGRLVQSIQNTGISTTLMIGSEYRPGVYYAEVVQGNQRRLLKLVKEAN